MIHSRHPEYTAMVDLWEKYRLTYEGGSNFLDAYLEKFSQRENAIDFENRKAVSYVPAFAKAAINEIVYSIFQRMVDITRKGGPSSYQNAIAGLNGGVDRKSSTMNNFIGTNVLPKLLSIGKVGIYVDMYENVGNTLADILNVSPYMYIYDAQDILSWVEDPYSPGYMLKLLLRDSEYEFKNGLPIGTKTTYRYMEETPEGVHAIILDDSGEPIRDTTLNIPRIPFVVVDIGQSLLTDVADIQIALLNLASSDINYSFRSNFPFYTEQYDPRTISSHIRQNSEADLVSQPGTAKQANTSKPQEIVTGATRGRRYPIGAERPAYIHPSSEPLQVSMDKQEQLKKDIKLLVNLAVSNLIPRREASAESKAMDAQSLEAGLSSIGQVLENGENRLAEVWALYTNVKGATVRYPTHYSLKTDEQRIGEALKKVEIRSSVPSLTYQKEISKDIAHTLLVDKVSPNILGQIYSEIDSSKIPILDQRAFEFDIENGLVSINTASIARGYPNGEVDKAKQEHAERAARIAAAQASIHGNKDMGARGVPDLSNNNRAAKEEKTKSQKKQDFRDRVKDRTRGEE